MSHPRALYLVDLVRDKRRFLQGVGGGRPWGRTGAQLGRNLWWIVSRVVVEWRTLMQNMWKVRKKRSGVVQSWDRSTTYWLAPTPTHTSTPSLHWMIITITIILPAGRYDNECVEKWWSSQRHQQEKNVFSLLEQKSLIHTIDGCLKYLKGGEIAQSISDPKNVWWCLLMTTKLANLIFRIMMIAMVMIMVTTMMMMKMIFLVKGRPAVSGADGMMAAAAGEAGLHIVIIICVITIITFISAILPLRFQVYHHSQPCHHHYCGFSLITVTIPVIITVISWLILVLEPIMFPKTPLMSHLCHHL